ncbi:peptide-methionine (S)-S-oxide reductase MsrA [Hymenobacter sp. DG25A]|uniref:peptide-methionine (S)-S-oxide reductase MsrA n=1 Tax=Hymenobacter sp. DG25A TaxID=1385663 RepID=UPI00397739A8
MKTMFFLVLTMLSIASCDARPGAVATAAAEQDGERFATLPKPLPGEAVATFASGCFWRAEHVFENLRGVRAAISGYAGGTTANPTYQQVGHGSTGHAEAVQVYYDPKIISYETLTKVFFAQHDPTTLNRQDPDVGPEYRSVAFYRTPQEKEQLLAEIQRVNASKRYGRPVVTQVVPFKAFYPAEQYHQEYLVKHPENPYIQHVSLPHYQQFAREFPQLLKK